MNWKFLFFSLQGRISRAWWWIGMLSLLLGYLGLSALLYWLLGDDPTYLWNDTPLTPTIALADAIAFVLMIRLVFAVDIKRIHDIGRSAWWLVPSYLGDLLLIAVVGIYLKDIFDIPGWSMTFFPILLYGLGLFVLLAAHKGTPGTSKYGPDPLKAVTKPTDETL